MNDLPGFEKKLGYDFSEKSLLVRALTHRSYSKDHNERLEFLGDSLVNALIAEQLFHLYSEVPEGHLSAMRAALVRRETLAEIAVDICLGEALLLGGGTIKTGGHRLESILADAYEAVLGAIYLDSDWQTVSSIVKKHFETRVSDLEVESVRDAKSRLQELLQAQGQKLPEYITLGVEGPGHAQRFKIQCVIECLQSGFPEKDFEFFGEGSNRRTAEQQAAAAALKALEVDIQDV